MVDVSKLEPGQKVWWNSNKNATGVPNWVPAVVRGVTGQGRVQITTEKTQTNKAVGANNIRTDKPH